MFFTSPHAPKKSNLPGLGHIRLNMNTNANARFIYWGELTANF